MEKGPVDPMIALNELCIFRLSARVLELRKSGHKISKRMVEVRNRFGEECHVAQYWLEAA